MKRAYKRIAFPEWKMAIIEKAIEIVRDYQRQGYDLTLRQVYYQFVARDLFPERWIDPKTGSKNNQRSYSKLGELLGDARLAGVMDWEAMVDRTREKSGNSHWESPDAIIRAVAQQYQIDKWRGQDYRPEIWVEKDALEGVVATVCRRLDVSYFSCRGYTSLTSIWENAQALKGFAQAGQKSVILHLGDHDPSGIDMSRDIEERVRLFMDGFGDGDGLVFERIALNMDQVRRYNPPENPAKSTDSRYESYIEEHGEHSWELDALDPNVIAALIEKRVKHYRDDATFAARQKIEKTEKALLGAASANWTQVADLVEPMIETEDDEPEPDEDEDDEPGEDDDENA
jgi:hypothetical protein